MESGEIEGRLRRVMRDVWGYDTFRPHQRAAMEAVARGRDSLVVLPTGGGKSICFQAPALIRPGTAVVVSPLISLMRDQVAQLAQAGVSAGCLHTGQPTEERREVGRALDQGSLKLLYLSPERLAMEDLDSILGRARLSFVAVDEAHCISSWGHDFRPEYRQIARLRERFPEVDMHGYTATATREVASDITAQMRLRNPLVLRGSFDRPNLYYSVKPKRGALGLLIDVIRRHPDQPGIVYCISRRETENVASDLRRAGHRALAYHAGLSPETRMAAQDDFVADRVNIIVATIAFGMGINKPDVRYVVHMGMPASIENFQQESGRAGRDGLPSECLLLFSMQDLILWKKINSESPPELQASYSRKLNRIHEWCSAEECRRRGLLRYFGEKYPQENCGRCDVCSGGRLPIRDAHVTAQMILSCIVRLGDAATLGYTADILLAKGGKKTSAAGHDKLSTFGLLKTASRDHLLDWIQQLTERGMAAAGEGGILTVTPSGWDILRNKSAGIILDRLSLSKTPRISEMESLTPMQLEDFERLRAFRKKLAEEAKVPPYVIFGDVTLRDMVQSRPRDLTEMSSVKGVGKVKLESYGEAFLAALWEGRERPSSNRGGRRESTVVTPKGRAFRMFRDGVPLDEVAKVVERAASTVATYLIEYIVEEGITTPEPYVTPEVESRVLKAKETAGDGLRPLFEALGQEVSFLEIRIVLACEAQRKDGGGPSA